MHDVTILCAIMLLFAAALTVRTTNRGARFVGITIAIAAIGCLLISGLTEPK